MPNDRNEAEIAAARADRRARQRHELAESLRHSRGHIDYPFFFLTLIILTLGVIMVLSASFARAYYVSGDPTRYFVRQMAFAVSGVFIALVASRIPVSFYRRVSWPVMLISLASLVAIIFIGSVRNGARRWIEIGGIFTVQPSEITKLAVIMFFSLMICQFRDRMRTIKYGMLPFIAILAVISILLQREPHYSAIIIILCLGAVMLFVGGVHWAWFAGGLALGGAGLFIIVERVRAAIAAGGEALESLGYIGTRLVSWLDPFSDMQDKGFQIIQSLYAVGSGGVLGLGLGQGRQKYLYLPEEHNDFIFSVVCEELGFVGAVLILLLFALLIIRGYWIALHSRDRYGSLLVTGITSLLALQVFFNVAVVTNLIPCTGISLPFFSYGGTALWLQMLEMGIILAVSRDVPLRGESDETDEPGEQEEEQTE